jgi:flagellar protein FlgJ
MIRLDAAGTPDTTSATGPTTDKLARLKDTTKKFEGVFVEQMFKAMRETVPHDGVADGGQGEEIFSGMMDQKIADRVPQQWHRGLADALFRELRDHVQPETK